MAAETDYAAKWRSLTPAQRERIQELANRAPGSGLGLDKRRHYGPFRFVGSNAAGTERKLTTLRIIERYDCDESRTTRLRLTDLGRALFAWAAEHGEAVDRDR
jgi:DNA-binding MarR family transcriptional regulator